MQTEEYCGISTLPFLCRRRVVYLTIDNHTHRLTKNTFIFGLFISGSEENPFLPVVCFAFFLLLFSTPFKQLLCNKVVNL